MPRPGGNMIIGLTLSITFNRAIRDDDYIAIDSLRVTLKNGDDVDLVFFRTSWIKTDDRLTLDIYCEDPDPETFKGVSPDQIEEFEQITINTNDSPDDLQIVDVSSIKVFTEEDNYKFQSSEVEFTYI